MKKRKNNSSGAWALRITLSVLLVLVSTILLVSSFKAAPPPSISLGGSSATTSTTSGARIYVTTTAQKIGGIGTGGCSLQEAIYSSVLHSSFFANYFGGHGIAIDATDPDHFIATDCVAGTGNGDTIVLPSGGMFTFNSTTHPPGYVDGDAYTLTGRPRRRSFFLPSQSKAMVRHCSGQVAAGTCACLPSARPRSPSGI